MAKRKIEKEVNEVKDVKAPVKQELRVDNFKVVFTETDSVPVIEVSNLECTWMVRIPAHFEMYGMLNRLLQDKDDSKKSVSENAKEWLKMFFMNFQNATSIPNGYFQQALVMLTGVYIRPEMLKSSFFGVGRKFYSDVKRLRLAFLKWADESKKKEQADDSQIDMEKEALADDSKHVLS